MTKKELIAAITKTDQDVYVRTKLPSGTIIDTRTIKHDLKFDVSRATEGVYDGFVEKGNLIITIGE